MIKEYYNVKEISCYLGFSIPYIRKLYRSRRIPYYKIDRKIVFKINEIERWLQEYREETKEEIRNKLFS